MLKSQSSQGIRIRSTCLHIDSSVGPWVSILIMKKLRELVGVLNRTKLSIDLQTSHYLKLSIEFFSVKGGLRLNPTKGLRITPKPKTLEAAHVTHRHLLRTYSTYPTELGIRTKPKHRFQDSKREEECNIASFMGQTTPLHQCNETKSHLDLPPGKIPVRFESSNVK